MVITGDEHTAAISALQGALGYSFKDHNILLTSLTHRSAARKSARDNYEKLEYLGDAVLDLSIAHMLIKKFPSYEEGDLSKMRAALVNAESLARIARGLKIGSLLILSPSELKSGGTEKNSILADVVEALLGAIYLEAGFEKAFKSVEKLFGDKIGTVQPKDPKTELQEKLHALQLSAPEYLIESSTGPVHSPVFVTKVIINGKEMGTGRGTSKKASQQAAALEALKNITEGTEK